MKPFELLSHAVRAKEILTVIARHGFADLLGQIDLPAGIWQRFVPQPGPPRTLYERIRLAAEQLGPAFVKLGQFLSMRPDVLPHPLILELRKLQDQVTPRPFEELRSVLVEDLGCRLEEVFSEFDETPIASASLAQVYFARLRSDGRAVAIKVQKPGIRRILETDLDLASWLAGQLHQHITALRPYDLPAVLAEASRGVQRELDFGNEARNQEYFNTLNPHPDRVFAPRVIHELSTGRVLVMERVNGHPVRETTPVPSEQLHTLAIHGAESLIRQVLIAGFFHADPHSGNVFVTDDGRLSFLDWGLAGHLTRRYRYALADFWVAAVEHDAERIVQIAADLAPPDARPDLRTMEKEVTLTLREDLNFDLGRPQLGRAMLKLLFIFGRQGIHLSRDYCLMAKAVLAIEEVGRTLDPQFDLRAHTRSVLREVYRERHSPRTILRRTQELLRNSLTGLHELPAELHRLVRRLEHDNLTVNLQHHGLQEIDEAMRVAANRIALGVVIGSLIIGSSLIITTGIEPSILGYPALGLFGYLISAMLGFYVIWDIIRHGRHK
ncbi:MAG: AarF/UbiB family protein [Opitutaceae bacterium]|nr:AarF/UbiB family protein [Opitutaceae bacterium]